MNFAFCTITIWKFHLIPNVVICISNMKIYVICIVDVFFFVSLQIFFVCLDISKADFSMKRFICDIIWLCLVRVPNTLSSNNTKYSISTHGLSSGIRDHGHLFEKKQKLCDDFRKPHCKKAWLALPQNIAAVGPSPVIHTLQGWTFCSSSTSSGCFGLKLVDMSKRRLPKMPVYFFGGCLKIIIKLIWELQAPIRIKMPIL